MKMARIVAGAAAVVIAAGFAVSQPEGAPAMDKKTLATMLAQKGAPGEEHKALEALSGSFDAEISFSFGGPPITSKTTVTSDWVLGKRFIQAESRSTPDEELKMESISYFGFDKRSKKYFWWGIDSTDTYSVFAEGGYDEATRTFTLHGENEEPGMGKVPFKTVIKVESPDKNSTQILFQMKGAPGADADGWFKVMEMTQTRKKG